MRGERVERSCGGLEGKKRGSVTRGRSCTTHTDLSFTQNKYE